MLTGDYGGFLYAVCRASLVSATAEALEALAVDLDATFSRRPMPYATRVDWVVTNRWDEWGWEPTADGLWVHDRLLSRGLRADRLLEALSAKTPRL